MSMYYYAHYADVISPENIEMIIPSTWKHFVSLCENHLGGGWENYIKCKITEELCVDTRSNVLDDDSVIMKEINAAFSDLIDKFHGATELKLECGYHYPEDGSNSDEVSGSFFWVNGCYIKSPEYERVERTFGPVVDRKFYVTFG